MVVYEKTEKAKEVEYFVHIFSRDNPDYFREVPVQFLESNLLLFYIYT